MALHCAIVRPPDDVENAGEPGKFRLDASFLSQLAQGRLICRFAQLDAAAGQAPAAGKRRLRPLNHENEAAAKDAGRGAKPWNLKPGRHSG